MANFDSGVASYIFAEATVRVGFPVDFRGNQEINCHQCRFYRRNYRNCGLNGEICEFPEKFVGSHCPLEIIKEDEPNEKNRLE